MDPGPDRPRLPPRTNTEPALNAVGPVIFHSPFDAASENVSNSLIRQQPARPLLWGDVSVRRFSSPSFQANQQRLAVHIDSARTAYAKAFVAIQKSVRDVDAAAILSRSSETDVAQTALELLNQGSSNGDDRGRVAQFLDILHHYHTVFDVLSQAGGDFGYLPVIWGGMKLVMMMAKNKRELLSKLTDSLIDIGLSLSRIEVYSKLFSTARMVELVSMLYAAVADFLQEIAVYFTQKSGVRKMLSSLVRPFEEKFGRAKERIEKLESCIEKDAMLLHAMQTASMAEHQLDAYLQRQHFQTTLNNLPPPAHPLHYHQQPHPQLDGGQLPDMFHHIKQTLFRGFHDQATYHESLAATYSVTARAWEKWFAVEQRHLPSAAVPGRTRLSQGLCDAPDHQHALQWAAQQRALSPHLPSAYLIWAQGMTVHTAIASLIFQVLAQRKGAVAEFGLDMGLFYRAAVSVRTLWDVFVYLIKKLGGCLIYISIGSAGPDEFAVVERFVKTVREWDGPPIWVTMIHPYNEGFAGLEHATDLDGLYDVHPSLTTTDALHHVLMLELDIHQVSDTIQTVLWEAVWRETRYASVGISFTRVIDAIHGAAEELAAQRKAEDGALLLADDSVRKLWLGGVQRWIDNPVASNSLRELVQRHLDIVDLALPDEIRDAIHRHLKRLVVLVDNNAAASMGSRSMTQIQRNRVWDRMKAAIVPGAEAIFCGRIRELVAEALDSYAELPGRNARQAGLVIIKLLDERFGMDGAWKSSLSDDGQPMVRAIVEAIMTGFADTIEALSEPGDPEEPEFGTGHP